jgi:DNA-directed RNA polymerase specialized sigma24 family protein
MPKIICLADRLVSSLSEYFDDRLPPSLGREAYGLIKKQLRRAGLFDDCHAEEVLSMALTDAIGYLRRHEGGAGIRQPRAWFHTLCRHTCSKYLRRHVTSGTSYAYPLWMEAEAELLSDASLSEEHIFTVLRQALKHLRARQQQFIVLELVECLPPAKLREVMQLPSDGAFRKLKHEAFTALRGAILAHIDGQLRAGRRTPIPEPDGRNCSDGLAVAQRGNRTSVAGNPDVAQTHAQASGSGDQTRVQAVPAGSARVVAGQGVTRVLPRPERPALPCRKWKRNSRSAGMRSSLRCDRPRRRSPRCGGRVAPRAPPVRRRFAGICTSRR